MNRMHLQRVSRISPLTAVSRYLRFIFGNCFLARSMTRWHMAYTISLLTLSVCSELISSGKTDKCDIGSGSIFHEKVDFPYLPPQRKLKLPEWGSARTAKSNLLPTQSHQFRIFFEGEPEPQNVVVPPQKSSPSTD